jgi:hypothetical protein
MEFLKKISTKVKVIFGAIIGILGFFLLLVVRDKILAKEKMAYELSRVESELKITHLEENSVKKIKRLTNLRKEEALIREKILFLEEKEATEGREVSIEELDAFFNSRGL